jgi:nucleoid-associated protein YejK
MKKFAETLAREYEREDKADFFEYIVESLINGQRQQVRNLFNEMKKDSQREFLNDYLESDGGYQESTRKICIAELCS